MPKRTRIGCSHSSSYVYANKKPCIEISLKCVVEHAPTPPETLKRKVEQETRSVKRCRREETQMCTPLCALCPNCTNLQKCLVMACHEITQLKEFIRILRGSQQQQLPISNYVLAY